MRPRPHQKQEYSHKNIARKRKRPDIAIEPFQQQIKRLLICRQPVGNNLIDIVIVFNHRLVKLAGERFAQIYTI